MTLVIGHSHTDCLQKAAIARNIDISCFNLWLLGPPLLRENGNIRLHPAIEDRLEPLVVSLIGGAAHDVIGLFQHPAAFDFVLPERSDLPLIRGAEIISYPIIQAAIAALIGPDETELAGVIAASGTRVLHLESPAPFGDNGVLGQEVGMMASLWNRPLDSKPSPPWLRYKLWRAHSAIVRQRCESHGVEFIPVPPDSLVDGDFLDPRYHAYPCHANEAYGSLLLSQLDMLAESASS